MNISLYKPIDRRAFLRGTGTCLSLPFLEAMLPASLHAESQNKRVPRMGMFYFGTGMNMRQFYPESFGMDAPLSRILKPLENQRGQFTVLSGTCLEHGGGHDGAYPFATAVPRGSKQTISPDQMAAEIHGKETRFPSLQLSVKRGTGFGSQALATISWNQQGVPLAAENDPKALFNKLFQPMDAQSKLKKKKEFRQRGSILDTVLEQARGLNKNLNARDKDQMEQYFHSIREVEKNLEREIGWVDKPKVKLNEDRSQDYEKAPSPEGNGRFIYDTYSKLMYDLISLAFQTDSTRVISYVVRTELAGGVYPEFGVSKGYHELSHHGNDPKNLEELAKVDTIYMQQWNYFLTKLSQIPDVEGSLLDNTILGFSSGMGIGHSKNNLPTVISGGAGLGIKHQIHLDLPENTPLSALWQTMVSKMGVDTPEPFQDSPGLLSSLLK